MPMRLSGVGFECGRVDRLRLRQRMEVEIDDGRSDILDGRKTLAEIPRRDQPLQQILGDRLAGLVVFGEAPQHIRLLEPMLVKLRRQLDEIGGDIGAGNARIGHRREQAVKRVAEFVKQRAGIVEAQQRRFAVRRLGEVAHIDDQRTDVAGESVPDRAATSSRRRCAWRGGRNSRRRTIRPRRHHRRAPPRPARPGCQVGMSVRSEKRRPNRRSAV